MNLAEVLKTAAERLRAASIEDPLREARILWSGVSPKSAISPRTTIISAQEYALFENVVSRRCRHEPVAYIFGRREFWSLEFEVTPDVLIPRPDTETLIETALLEFAGRTPQSVLDLGTGSGCIIVTLLKEWPQATGVGVDISEPALAVAARNALAHGVDKRLSLERRDFTVAAPDRFDLVVSNPPYISENQLAKLDADVRDFEPVLALRGGAAGTELISKIAATLPLILKPGGKALVEIGFDQGLEVQKIFENQGFLGARVVKDLSQNDRVVVATMPH